MKGRKQTPRSTGGDSPLKSNKPAPGLTKSACVIWKQTLERVHAAGGEIPSRFEQVLAAYCESGALVARAAIQLESEGLTITDRRGTPVKHPASSVLTQATSQVRALGETLGLSPASAARLPRPVVEDENPFAEFT